MKDNFNALNIGMLLLGILLILSAVYNRKVGDLIRGIGSGDLSVFAPGDATTGKFGEPVPRIQRGGGAPEAKVGDATTGKFGEPVPRIQRGEGR